MLHKEEALFIGSKIIGKKTETGQLEKERTYLHNKKLFGVFNTKLRLYQKGVKRLNKNNGSDTSKLQNWLIKNGDPPVIYDPKFVQLEKENLRNFLIDKGYINTKVTHETFQKFGNDKLIGVKYFVKSGPQWLINSVHSDGFNKHFDSILQNALANNQIAHEKPLDLSFLKKVKTELLEQAQNNGYFYFDVGLLNVWIDTNCSNKRVDIYFDYHAEKDKKVFVRQKIDTVEIIFDSEKNHYQEIQLNGINYKTLAGQLKPEVLDNLVKIRPDEIYNPANTTFTYNNLLNLAIFKSVNINFTPSKEDSSKLLKCSINLKQKKNHEVVWEPQVIFNSERQINQNRSYGNKRVDIYFDYHAEKDKKVFVRQKIDTVEIIFDSEKNHYQEIQLNGINYKTLAGQLKPEVLDNLVKIRPDEIYNPANTTFTYNNLLNLAIFKSVNINFTPSKEDSSKLLKCSINLKQKKNHEVVWEPQVIFNSERQINQNRSYGLQNLLKLNNRDVFGHAEQFDINWTLGLESQYGAGIFKINSISNNINLDLILPFLALGRNKFNQKSFDTKQTIFAAGFIKENNVIFNRTSFPFSFIYEINKKNWSYQFSPLQISFNNASINNKQNELNNLVIRRLLNNNLIAGSKFSMFFNSVKNGNYFKSNMHLFELSGNAIGLYHALTSGSRTIDKTLFNVRYFQYVRSELDVKSSRKIGRKSNLAVRINVGAGIPYGNSDIMPFEKQYFVGGANSLRAFKPRSVGPGNYAGSSGVQFEKSGDLITQASLELRNSIGKSLFETAFFIDAGNCWLVTEHEDLKNGSFKMNNTIQSLALNSGAGLRLNLGYFIFRMDWGIALHNPSKPKNQRWVINSIRKDKILFLKYNTLLNIGIGYPF